MLSLYIHTPFCVRKCAYCGFYSTPYSRQKSELFISALETEASGSRPAFGTRLFETVYVGGGTPTALSLKELDKVLNIPRQYFPVSPEAEYTVEANPNSFCTEQLSLFRHHGVNRLSLGIQSFDDRILAFLGRLHTARQAVDAFQMARTAGIRTVSIDLIFGIPGQSRKQWQKDLEQVRSLGPDHVSVYSLSIDRGSRFGEQADKGMFKLPDEERAADLYEMAAEELEKAGFDQYEISNFSRPGFRCRHNSNYWERGEYLGLGPGAWSFVDSRRYNSVADVLEYSRRLQSGQSVCEESETIDCEKAAMEMVMLALRTDCGLDLERYRGEFGAEASDRLMIKSEPLERSGLLASHSGRIRLTRSGFLVANEALNSLLG